MGFIGGGPVVEELDAKFWRLAEPLVYQGAVQTFTVPVDFRTDFASVPRAVVWLIPRYGAYTRAAILHDYLCRTGVVGRADADGLFRRCLREFDVSVPRRWMMWAAVRLGSRWEGISAKDFLRWVLIAVPSLVFLFVPVVVVTTALLVFWLVELAFWALHRTGRRVVGPPPTPQMKTA